MNTNQYNYLLNLPIHSFTLEKVQELEDEISKRDQELEILSNTSIKDMWIQELEAFEEQYKRRC